MGKFFRGWRRKIGVLTLLPACLFACGWIKSLYLEDIITVVSWTRAYQIISERGCLCVKCQGCDADEDITQFYRRQWHSIPIAEEPVIERMIERNALLHSVGFAYEEDRDVPVTTFTIYYWLLVTPLSLLSAWLLLSKQPPVTRPDTIAKDDQ